MTMRVVFFGNQQSVFSSRHFQALLGTDANLVAVVDAPAHKQSTSNPLPPGLGNFVQIARDRGIPSFNPRVPEDEEFTNRLVELEPDFFLAVGYPMILKPRLLAIPGRMAANFHASLLPHYRGKHPVFWALRAGERWAGLTVHVMDPGIDTGDILYQIKVRTRREDTVASLYRRIINRSEALVGQLITDLEHDSLKPKPQPPGEGSYYSSIDEEDFGLEWSWPAEKLRRFVTVTPGKCFIEIQGRQICFLNAGTFPLQEMEVPGTILWLGRARVGIATGDDGFWSSRVESRGQTISMAVLCREMGLAPGDRLN